VAAAVAADSASGASSGERRTVITQVSGGGLAPAGSGLDARTRGIGSRFRSASNDTGRLMAKEKKP
ncbi:type VI secretion protein, partial [Novosphingobium sp. 1949]|nr:type VI secretion protein [Novosphingobium organovorum]